MRRYMLVPKPNNTANSKTIIETVLESKKNTIEKTIKEKLSVQLPDLTVLDGLFKYALKKDNTDKLKRTSWSPVRAGGQPHRHRRNGASIQPSAESASRS